MKTTKGCGKLSSKYTFFGDSCIIGVKTVEEANIEGVDYCCTVKTIHCEFFIATMVTLTKEFPGEYHIIMNISQIVSGGILPMYIGYNYISQKVLVFIAIEGAGSTELSFPYLSCLPDNYSYICFFPLFVLA